MWNRVVCAVAAFLLLSATGRAQESAPARLAECRTRIDAVDATIVKLLNERAALVERVGAIKAEAGLPVAAPAREQQVLQRAVEIGKAGPLPPQVLKRIYEKILQEMRDWEASQVRDRAPAN